jgi:hypothetical protein
VWVPVGTNVALVALAALMSDSVAVALSSMGAVVVTCAVVLHIRESNADKERIAHLQATLPNFIAPVDAEGALNLAPKPSPVVSEVLRQQKPTVSLGPATPISIPPVGTTSAPIDRP